MDKSGDAKDLDLTFAGRGVWLVKVPKYMSECWAKAKSGQEVGKVVISTTRHPTDPAVKPLIDVAFHINEPLAYDTSAEPTKIPTEHKFVMKKEGRKDLPLSLAVLSTEPLAEPASGSQNSVISEYRASIEGRVIDKAECRPTGDAGYMALKRNRMEAGNKPQKEVVQLSKPVNSYKPVSIHETQLEYEQKKKDEGKKIRLEKEQVQELLFAAFEKHQYYNVKDLVRITNQPITFLKEILKEICVYNMKAPHKNMWELKAEYRHYKSMENKDVS
jgi:transcription initiation factor TFIIF subunit beta